jgi:hypothetical protein|tara:strand:+ start:979 stop:1236 length:258 start_codon:yes stop_codon:yes gene_type:complete
MKLRIFLVTIFTSVAFSASAAGPPTSNNEKSRFYDFQEQLIDGEIRRPTFLYTDAHQQARFERLLNLKKSFLPRLFSTSKERVFK